MSADRHRYRLSLTWRGNVGSGTSSYTNYQRDYQLLHANGAADIAGSADPAFRGDPNKWNPEELLLGSLAACHQLWYLHLCADAGVIVLAYEDSATGVMGPDASGIIRFEEVTLRPQATLAAGSDSELARSLHPVAAKQCFIANSVNFPVRHEPSVVFSDT